MRTFDPTDPRVEALARHVAHVARDALSGHRFAHVVADVLTLAEGAEFVSATDTPVPVPAPATPTDPAGERYAAQAGKATDDGRLWGHPCRQKVPRQDARARQLAAQPSAVPEPRRPRPPRWSQPPLDYEVVTASILPAGELYLADTGALAPPSPN